MRIAKQVAESRALGADAILVILAMVDDSLARTLMDEAARLGMDALVEDPELLEPHVQPLVHRAEAMQHRSVEVDDARRGGERVAGVERGHHRRRL